MGLYFFIEDNFWKKPWHFDLTILKFYFYAINLLFCRRIDLLKITISIRNGKKWIISKNTCHNNI